MKEKRYILIHANKYDIEEPEFFDTYYDAHELEDIWYVNKMTILNEGN